MPNDTTTVAEAAPDATALLEQGCASCEPVSVFDAGAEAVRVAALHRTGLLDTPAEEPFDRLTRLATRLLGAPVALLSLLDRDRQFLKSAAGQIPTVRETPRSVSFCQHVVAERRPLIIADAREHPLMRHSPLIQELGIIAYLGVPVLAEGVHVIGSLSVNDSRPRAWTEEDVRTLQELSEITMTEIALRGKLSEREAALRESELRFREVAENIEHVFWMATPNASAVHYVSPAYERLWGRTCASFYADPLTFMEAIVPEDWPLVLAAKERNAGGRTFEIEYRVKWPDGSLHWMHDRGFPVFDEHGVVVRTCGIVEEITERKKTEAELKNTHVKLMLASHAAGKAEVATNVLHNVGNVLNSVNISLGVATEKAGRIKTKSLARLAELLAQHEGDLPGFFANHPQGTQLPHFLGQLARQFAADQQTVLAELALLRGNIEHINEIVAMQQSYASGGGVFEVLPLTDLIEDALRMNSAAFDRHGTRIERDFDETLPVLCVDRNKVLLILVNLLRNAKYACDESGRTEKRIVVRTHRDGDGFLKISVCDNGVGIPAENLTRIFEHGFTTRKAGHGFGLHSSALVASDIGGALRVHSAGLGAGATFCLELPLSPA